VRIISIPASRAACCSSSAIEMLGEIHVGVHEAGRHHPPASVDHPVGRAGRVDFTRGADMEDAGAVHQDGAVGEDAS